jgi:hypothetical protein
MGLLEREMERYKIHKVLGQCHSALEHTFLWIVYSDEPHKLRASTSYETSH